MTSIAQRLARGPASRWCLGGVLILATLLRLGHVLALRPTPWFDHLVVDPEYYDAWAQRIAAGDWLGDRPFYMDPLYPYCLALLYKLFGRDLLLVRLLQVGLSAGTCALIAALGRRVRGRIVGGLAALGFALYAPEIFYVAEIDKTCLSVFLTCGALVLAFGRSVPTQLAAGAVLGLASLTRANFLLLAPFAVLRLLLAFDDGKKRVGGVPRSVVAATAFAAGVVVTLLPVAWRNYSVSGEWVLTTSQAGQNFYTGNNPTNPYGAYGALPFVRGNPRFEEIDFRAAAETAVGHSLSAGDISRFWFSQAFEHMHQQPGFAARAMLRKLVLFWNDFEISDNQDQYLLERESWVLRLPLLSFGWIAAFAALGAIVGYRSNHAVRVLCGFVLLYCTSVVAFFIFSRYRIQVVPALLPLAAIGAIELAGRIHAFEWKRVATGTLIVLGAGVFCFQTIGIFSRYNDLVIEMQLRHMGEIYLTAGKVDEAIAIYQEGVSHCPTRCPQSLEELFNTYMSSGRLADGTTYFRTFMREHPEDAEGQRCLARLLDAAGQSVPFTPP